MEAYLREINETPLLGAEEERELAYRVWDGDVEARDQMVRANLRLVVTIARSYTGKGLGLQDLIEEGNLGLLRAVEGFDPDMNTRFSTYASFWIRQAIMRALVNTGKTIRIPAYLMVLLFKWRRASARLQEELGRPPTQEETARSLGLTRRQLKLVKRALPAYHSTRHGDEAGSGRSLDEALADARAKTPDAGMLEAEELQNVRNLLGKMDPREAAVLRMRFGLGGEEPRTLKEIGERLGITRERVRQIEGEALGKLREAIEAG